MKKRITALALALGMVMGTVALAAGAEKTISVTPMGLAINGQAVTATASNGATGEVFASDGVTYAPVRYLCELLGIDVEWDKNDPNTVKLAGDITIPTQTALSFKAGTYTGVGTGMGGQVKVAVTFSANAITAVTVGENNETPGIGTPAIEQLPGRIVEGQSLALDVVSGATLTSNAILDAVADAATQAGCDAGLLRSAPVKKADTAKAAEEYTADVCVIGAGGAGLFGALEAAEAGASVIVLEKSATCLASNSNQIGGTCAVESVITKANGELIGEYTSGTDGFINVPELSPGFYIVSELRSPEGYLQDQTPKTIEVKANVPTLVEFPNKQMPGLRVEKIDKVTGLPVGGAKFKVVRANGEVYETQAAKGYIHDPTPQTVELIPNKTTVLQFADQPLMGLQIKKVDDVTGKPMAGVSFKLSELDGRTIGTYVTDDAGLIFVPNLTAGSWVVVEETRTLPGYRLDNTPVMGELAEKVNMKG